MAELVRVLDKTTGHKLTMNRDAVIGADGKTIDEVELLEDEPATTPEGAWRPPEYAEATPASSKSKKAEEAQK
jgi:hypothetical protein